MFAGPLIASLTVLGQAEPLHETGAAYADNMYVHQWIANEAFRYFSDQIEGAELGAWLGTIQGSFGASDANLLEGTFAEDGNYRDPLNQLMPYNRHFCAGADGAELDDGFLWYDSATTQAARIWNDYVLPVYPANKPLAYYRLGHVAHLLADMTIPAHVHNDDHALSEPYENAMGANERFKLYYFGCTRAGLGEVWAQPVGMACASLRELFYRTANYTEDYDSGDVNGDVTNGSLPYQPDDYPAGWHRPGEVSRSGGMSDAEITITADDLMPYAIRRTAELYRMFYRAADASAPEVAMTWPDATDPASPAVRGALDAFTLTAAAGDPQSGVVKLGYRFLWTHWDGAAWSDWALVAPDAGGPAASFAPDAGDGLYAFKAVAENGGGLTADAPATYLRIDLPPPPTPLQAWLEAWRTGLPEADRAPLGDMNHDGLNNFLVYVAGGDPTRCDGLVPLRMELRAGAPHPVLRLRGDDPHMVYQLRLSDDMAAWTAFPVVCEAGAWRVEGGPLSLAGVLEVQPGVWEMTVDDATGRNPVIYTLEADYDTGLW